MKLSANWSWVMVALLAFSTSFVAACASPPSNTELTAPDTGSNCSSPGALSKEDCLKDSGAPVDSGKPDTGTDTFVPDSSPLDTSVDSSMDSGTLDSGSPDTKPDTSPVDSTVDSTLPDTTPVDTGADTGVDTSVVDSGSADTGSDTGTPDTGVKDSGPTPLDCKDWTRRMSFNSFKIDGISDVKRVGGIWGTSSSSVYVSAGDYGTKTAVAHWNASSWTQEDLPLATGGPEQIWGTSDDNVWVVTASGGGKGRLYHRTGGVWTEDSKEPLSTGFRGVWGSDASNVFISGARFGEPYVWHRVGSNWVEMTLPTFTSSGGVMLRRLWGLDPENVFMTGCYMSSSTGDCAKGMLLHYNGTTWSEIATPADSRELYDVQGSSLYDLHVVGKNTSSQAVAYTLSGKMTAWSATVTPTMAIYMAVLSPKVGTLLAGGQTSELSAGSARVTTIDKMGPPNTLKIDSAAFGVAQFWAEPGSNRVHFVNDAPPTGVSGYYIGTCE